MQKNNVKSFICSFLFSILAVFAVQKVFLHANQTKNLNEESKNLTNQRISLFAENKVQTHQVPVLSSENIEDRKISKTDLGTPVIVAKENILPVSKDKPAITSKETLKPSVLTDLAYAEEITFSEEEQKVLDEEKNLSEVGVVYADISDTFEKDSFELADASVSEEIPLVEDNITVHSQINLQNAASASQIAMVEPNTLINSIQEPDILDEEKNLAEADIKKSELGEIMSLSENDAEIDESAWAVATAATEDFANDSQTDYIEPEPEDSPWVFAKGNKYAKNQAAVEEYGSLPYKQAKSEDTLVQEKNTDIQPVQDEEESSDTIENSVEEQISDISENDSETQNPDISEDTENPQTPDVSENETEVQNLSENQPFEIQEQSVIKETFNEPLLKEKENSSKLAYEMIQNILIPIPDNILNDANITPDLTASPDDTPEHVRHVVVQKPDLNEKEKESGLFKSISSWFNKNKDDTNKNSKASANTDNNNKEKTGTFQNLKDKVYSALGSVEDYQGLNDVSIMPAELRLSFAPNRAEISGQTLKWIYAFADNARDHNDVYIEVRIDGTSSYALQQKRLNLLSSIFATRGVDYRKINTVFTSREPNSFIIRNIRFNNSKGETNE